MNEISEMRLEMVANEIVKRKLTAPAILFLESVKPLRRVGEQTLIAIEPMLRLFIPKQILDAAMSLLGEEGEIENLIVLLERSHGH